MPGVAATRLPSCGRLAGNDVAGQTGLNCNVTDLCAPGWHVCEAPGEVARSSSDGCTSVGTGGLSLTRTSGPGGSFCGGGGQAGVFGCGDGVPRVVAGGAGSVAQDQLLQAGSVDALAGVVDVVMTGTGDADLYVRVGAEPTLTEYDCRPYGGDANESCAVAGPGRVFIAVNGFTASDFTLSVTYPTLAVTCAPLDAGLTSADCPADWACGAAGAEAAQVQRLVPSGGGVLCCRASCGNGWRDAEELCDDGDADPANGCANDCTCSPGFGGDGCGQNLDECAPNPCANGGLCADGVDAFTCTCPPTFTGPSCAVDVDECATGADDCAPSPGTCQIRRVPRPRRAGPRPRPGPPDRRLSDGRDRLGGRCPMARTSARWFFR